MCWQSIALGPRTSTGQHRSDGGPACGFRDLTLARGIALMLRVLPEMQVMQLLAGKRQQVVGEVEGLRRGLRESQAREVRGRGPALRT